MSAADGARSGLSREDVVHVATLDYDKDEIEARTVEFVTGVLSDRER